MRVSAKIIIPIIVLVLVLFAGIIALTQEIDSGLNDLDIGEDDTLLNYEDGFELERDIPVWVKPPRWFRSNAGGMALQEMQSRLTALRHEYALMIDYIHRDELPDYLISYYDEEYILEVRILYKNGEQQRTQWIFRDEQSRTRLNAVFIEPEAEIIVLEELSAVSESTEPVDSEEIDKEEAQTAEAPLDTAEIQAEEDVLAAQEESAQDETETEEIAQAENEEEDTFDYLLDVKNKKGFLELFNEESFLTMEYRYYENGRIIRMEYSLKDNLLIKAEYAQRNINKREDDFKTLYIDYYRYNRSLSLRNIERIFMTDTKFDDPVRVAFPRRILDAAREGLFIKERLNLYPEFFGNVYVYEGYKMIFDTDNRGRIMSQTLYDSGDKVVWVIHNIWQNNRIVSTTKTEGDLVLLAEYAYSSNGDIILERNLKNNILERVMRAEGNREIEELYMDNAVVLRAVWDNGRKISETRVRN